MQALEKPLKGGRAQRYAKAFRSIKWLMVGLPLGLQLAPESICVYPPVGASAFFTVPFATLLIGLSAAVPIAIKTQRRLKRAIFWCAGISLLALLSYFGTLSRFLVRIDRPEPKPPVVVLVGYARTEFAKNLVPNASDADLLKYEGVSEDRIEKLWTPQSIMIVRTSCFATYLAFLISLNLCVGCLARLSEEMDRRAAKR